MRLSSVDTTTPVSPHSHTMVRLSSRHDTTIVLVGDNKVGKSSLLAKFRSAKFDSSYCKTNLEKVNTSSIVQGQRVKFTIYDTSGKY